MQLSWTAGVLSDHLSHCRLRHRCAVVTCRCVVLDMERILTPVPSPLFVPATAHGALRRFMLRYSMTPEDEDDSEGEEEEEEEVSQVKNKKTAPASGRAKETRAAPAAAAAPAAPAAAPAPASVRASEPTAASADEADDEDEAAVEAEAVLSRRSVNKKKSRKVVD